MAVSSEDMASQLNSLEILLWIFSVNNHQPFRRRVVAFEYHTLHHNPNRCFIVTKCVMFGTKMEKQYNNTNKNTYNKTKIIQNLKIYKIARSKKKRKKGTKCL